MYQTREWRWVFDSPREAAIISNTTALILGALSVSLTACGTATPIAYSGLESVSELAPNAGDDRARVPYRYVGQVDWSHYRRVMVDPVVIYGGADHQFVDLTDGDKDLLAAYMQEQFSQHLSQRFQITDQAGAGTMRLKLTLTGATATTPVLGTLSRIDVAGAVYNGVQSVNGGEGSFTGAVIYAVEIRDARSNKLLAAFIAKQYPPAYDIGASFGRLDAAKHGLKQGAEELVAQLR